MASERRLDPGVEGRWTTVTNPMATLTAAVAETTARTLLHYDADFDHIASVTGQATEWVVPQGTLD